MNPKTYLPRVIEAAGYQTWHMGKYGNGFPAGLKEFQSTIPESARGSARATASQRLAYKTIEFLKARTASNEAKPFYIYLAPSVLHDPRSAEEQFHKMYDPAKIPLSPAFMPQHPFDNGDMKWPGTTTSIRQPRTTPSPPHGLRPLPERMRQRESGNGPSHSFASF